jgi:hypothetical protein
VATALAWLNDHGGVATVTAAAKPPEMESAVTSSLQSPFADPVDASRHTRIGIESFNEAPLVIVYVYLKNWSPGLWVGAIDAVEVNA